jgi:hypothetical protein
VVRRQHFELAHTSHRIAAASSVFTNGLYVLLPPAPVAQAERICSLTFTRKTLRAREKIALGCKLSRTPQERAGGAGWTVDTTQTNGAPTGGYATAVTATTVTTATISMSATGMTTTMVMTAITGRVGAVPPSRAPSREAVARGRRARLANRRDLR